LTVRWRRSVREKRYFLSIYILKVNHFAKTGSEQT
jgi:hypothetical protein